MKKIVEKILNSKKILIISHENPDGDAVGSTLGLYFGLKKLNKRVVPVLPNKVPQIYSFLEGAELIKTDFNPKDIDVAIILDCSDIGRVESLKKKLMKIPIKINIDHHPSNFSFGELNFIDPTSSSTSELVLKLLNELNVEVDKSIANPLYVGIMTDTGSFRFPNTTLKTFEAATYLVRHGAEASYLAKMVYNMKPLKALKILGRALEKLKKKDHLIYSVLLLSDFEEFDASEEDAEGAVEFLNKSREADVAVLLKERRENYFKVSMRSKDSVDVKKIAMKFGGGGHINAAGFEIEGEPEEIIESIIKEIKVERSNRDN